LLLASFAIGAIAHAKAPSTDIPRLVARSEHIVMGRVSSVRTVDGRQLADIEVATILKGPRVKTLTFLAQPTWTCDASKAVVGEELLLFLERDNTGLLITSNGRGRMPLEEIRGTKMALVYTYDVYLPAALNPKNVRDNDFPVHLEDLLAEIRRELADGGYPWVE
jgi:hypothetical protein